MPCGLLEVPAHLVVATVFKIAVSRVNRVTGGFDSHALPPFIGWATRAFGKQEC